MLIKEWKLKNFFRILIATFNNTIICFFIKIKIESNIKYPNEDFILSHIYVINILFISYMHL